MPKLFYKRFDFDNIIPRLTFCTSSLELLLQDNVTRKVAISIHMLQEKLDNIRGAVMMAYPMGLPAWDIVKLTIDGSTGLEGTSAAQEIFDEDTSEVWVASRCLDRSQSFSERFW